MQNRLLLWQMDCELSQSIWQNFAKETSLADYRLLPGSVRFTYLPKKRLIANNLFYFIEQLIDIQFIETLNRTVNFI